MCNLTLAHTQTSYSNRRALLKYELLIIKYNCHLILNICLLLLSSGMRNLDNCDSCLITRKLSFLAIGQGVLKHFKLRYLKVWCAFNINPCRCWNLYFLFNNWKVISLDRPTLAVSFQTDIVKLALIITSGFSALLSIKWLSASSVCLYGHFNIFLHKHEISMCHEGFQTFIPSFVSCFLLNVFEMQKRS